MTELLARMCRGTDWSFLLRPAKKTDVCVEEENSSCPPLRSSVVCLFVLPVSVLHLFRCLKCKLPFYIECGRVI